MIVSAVLLNYLDNDDNNNLMLVVAGVWIVALAIMKPLILQHGINRSFLARVSSLIGGLMR